MTRITQQVRAVNQENGHYEPANLIPPASGSRLEHNCNDAQERRTPLPKFQLLVVFLIQITEPIAAMVIYPFVNQFVQDTGITKGDDKKTGYYAGVIESVFFLAEAATAFQWGQLSDRFGRRPILLLGPLGLTFAMLRFGYSTSFWPMLWSRCMQGVFNGNISVSKTVLAELADATNIGDAFALLPLMWSSGLSIAPIIGGFLSNPATRWPDTFGKLDLFKQHPYLLPCLVVSLVSFCTFVIGFLGLRETHPSIASNEKPSKDKGDRSGSERLEDNSISPLRCHGSPSKYGATSSTCPPLTPSVAPSNSCSEPENNLTLRSVLGSRPIVLLLVNYAFHALTTMSYNVLVPLIYSTSVEHGGLGLTPYEIGLIIGVPGFINVFAQLNLFGKLIRRYGGNRLYKFTYASHFVLFLSFPISVYLARRNGAASFGVFIIVSIQVLFRVGSLISYGAIQVSIAESAPRTMLGSINGLFHMTACLMRTAAPTFSSSLFSLSLQKQILSGNLVYVVFLLIISVGIGFSQALPDAKGKTSTS